MEYDTVPVYEDAISKKEIKNTIKNIELSSDKNGDIYINIVLNEPYYIDKDKVNKFNMGKNIKDFDPFSNTQLDKEMMKNIDNNQ